MFQPKRIDGTLLDYGMGKAKDMTGARVGIITVLKDTGKTKYKKPSKVWLCKCDCGVCKEYSTTELLCGVKSCGCLRQKNLDTFGERNKGRTPVTALHPGESSKRSILSSYKQSAKKRRIPFVLKEATFRELIFGNCVYCGAPPSQTWKDRHREEGNVIHNGVDRINNNQGYTPENCVSCCKICNQAKGTMSVDEFSLWLNRVYSRREDWEQLDLPTNG